MPAWVYILQSATTGRHYCGQTDALEKRIQQHNDPYNTFTRTTKVFTGPWQLIWSKDLYQKGGRSFRIDLTSLIGLSKDRVCLGSQGSIPLEHYIM
jgi:hypothetical protein